MAHSNQYNFNHDHNHHHHHNDNNHGNNNPPNPFNHHMHGNNENSVKLEHNHSPMVKNESNCDTKHTQIKERIVSFHDEANQVFGCKHYARNCFLKAECCGIWYVCRFCHDERNEYLDHETTNNGHGYPDYDVKPHQFNRYSTQYVKCMRCGAEQEAAKYCNSCFVEYDEYGQQPISKPIKQEMKMDEDDNDEENDDEMNIKLEKKRKFQATSMQSQPYEFSKYYCDICKFYDDEDSKEIFHCLECGLCRLGNRTDYIHCQRCGCCLNYKYYAKHPCIENSLKSDCPICFTYLFKSREPVTFFMPCGHPIHYECLMQYTKVGNWKCPICRAGWYDEESEKRRKIVDAIKNMQQQLAQLNRLNNTNNNDQNRNNENDNQ